MSIKTLDRNSYIQDLSVNPECKALYGEIFTPFDLIENMFNMVNPNVFSDPSKTFLDAGAGSGFFSMMLYWRLMDGLDTLFPDNETKSTHIIENMLYMCELREENVTILKSLFGKNCNCIEGNFLEYTTCKFDYIIGI